MRKGYKEVTDPRKAPARSTRSSRRPHRDAGASALSRAPAQQLHPRMELDESEALLDDCGRTRRNRNSLFASNGKWATC